MSPIFSRLSQVPTLRNTSEATASFISNTVNWFSDQISTTLQSVGLRGGAPNNNEEGEKNIRKLKIANRKLLEEENDDIRILLNLRIIRNIRTKLSSSSRMD